MRALSLREDRTFALHDVDDPVLRAGGVAVRPTAVGICGTDLSIIRGTLRCPLPRVLGHEIAGVVAGGDGFAPGTRVVVNPTGYCDTCDACAAGRTAVCAEKPLREVGIAVDGGLASVVHVERRYVHPIPGDLPDEAAALVEPLACVVHAAARLGGGPALVVGAGPIGLLAATYLRAGGRDVAVLETSEFRRAAAAELVPGADVAAAPEALARSRYAAVLDTASVGLDPLLDLVGDGGSIVLMGCRPRAAAAFDPYVLTRRNVTVAGSCDYDASEFGEAVRRAPALRLERLVTHALLLEEHERLPALLGIAPGDYRAVKVVMRPNG